MFYKDKIYIVTELSIKRQNQCPNIYRTHARTRAGHTRERFIHTRVTASHTPQGAVGAKRVKANKNIWVSADVVQSKYRQNRKSRLQFRGFIINIL